MSILMRTLALSAMTLVAACGTQREVMEVGPAAEAESRVSSWPDERPVLLGCSRYTAPGDAYRERAFLSYIVNERGEVEEASIREDNRNVSSNGSRPAPASAQVIERARLAALSCTYRPARTNGQPVSARVTEPFMF
jgi:hypothetical protein